MTFKEGDLVQFIRNSDSTHRYLISDYEYSLPSVAAIYNRFPCSYGLFELTTDIFRKPCDSRNGFREPAGSPSSKPLLK